MAQRLQEESRAVKQDLDRQTIIPNIRALFIRWAAHRRYRLRVPHLPYIMRTMGFSDRPTGTGMSRGYIKPDIAKLKQQYPDMDIVVVDPKMREKEG